MATLYTHADANRRKTYFLIAVFFFLIIAVGYVFSVAYDSYAIAVIAVIVSVVMSFGSYWFSDKIVLAMSRAREVTRENAKPIYNVVENLCITAGLPVPRIFVIEDSAINAFATGRDPEHAVICLTTGAITRLEKLELEGVVAHELAHIGNRDMLLQTVVVILAGVITLMADFFWRFSFFGRRRSRDGGQLGLIIFLLAVVLSLLAPIAATLIKLSISRKREFLADASGALLTRYPEGLARALEKISQDTEPLEVANKATAHLYIENPLRNNHVGGFTKLFSTHPPVTERVAALRGMNIPK